MFPNYLLIQRAARAVTQYTDMQADFYPAQSAVEDWALEALRLALSTEPEERNIARVLLDRYEEAPWDLEDARDPRDPPLHLDDPRFRSNYTGGVLAELRRTLYPLRT